MTTRNGRKNITTNVNIKFLHWIARPLILCLRYKSYIKLNEYMLYVVFFPFFYTKRCFDSPWWECPWPWLSTVTKNWIWQISILMRWKKRKKVRFCTLPKKKIEIINVKIIWKIAFVLNFCYLFVDGIVVSYWIVKITKEEEL